LKEYLPCRTPFSTAKTGYHFRFFNFNQNFIVQRACYYTKWQACPWGAFSDPIPRQLVTIPSRGTHKKKKLVIWRTEYCVLV